MQTYYSDIGCHAFFCSSRKEHTCIVHNLPDLLVWDGTETSPNTTVTIEVIGILTRGAPQSRLEPQLCVSCLHVCPALSRVLFDTLFEPICLYACRVHCLLTAVLHVPTHHHNATGFGVIGQEILSEGGAAGNASFVLVYIY